MEFSYADHTDSSFLAYADDDDRNKYFLKFLPFADHCKNECDVNFEGAGRINATENMKGTDLFLFFDIMCLCCATCILVLWKN